MERFTPGVKTYEKFTPIVGMDRTPNGEYVKHADARAMEIALKAIEDFEIDWTKGVGDNCEAMRAIAIKALSGATT